ncbi:hypothetical protein KKA03_02160 [archaeon]|nr:hypothetical protein [archaeon]
MILDMYCIFCGGRLEKEGGNASCMECRTEFSNVLVSETAYESSENTFLEMSVSIDCVKAKNKIPQEIYPAREELPAAIICQ